MGTEINEDNYQYIFHYFPKIKSAYMEKNRQYEHIDNLGYVPMQLEEYKTWLNSLQETKNKQESEKIFIKLNENIERK
jgi:hypothetical protein